MAPAIFENPLASPRLLQLLHSGPRVLLGSVFVLSGVLKIYSPHAAEKSIGYLIGIGSPATQIAIAGISIFELVLGVILTTRANVTVPALGAALFLLACIFVGGLLISDPIPCGCFGDLVESRTDEWFLLRNLLLLGLAVLVLYVSAQPKNRRQHGSNAK